MLAAERALREGSELGPHTPALPPIAQGGGRGGGPLPPEPLPPHVQGGGPVGRPCISPGISPLIPPSGHHQPCSVQGRRWTGATLPPSPGQPHLAQVSVAFLQQRLRFTNKISRGFLSSLRPPSLCWGPVFRPLPAGASWRTKQGHQCSAVGHQCSAQRSPSSVLRPGAALPQGSLPTDPAPHPEGEESQQVASVLPSPGTRPQADRGNVESLFGSG